MPWTEADVAPADWAYLAGIIDGEGCLGVYTRRKRNRPGDALRVTYRPRLQVANTSEALMRWLEVRFGGVVREVPRKKHWKRCFTWNSTDVAVIRSIAANCLPYLVIKAEQARLVLDFPYRAKVNQWDPAGVAALAAVKHDLYERTLALNARGANDALD